MLTSVIARRVEARRAGLRSGRVEATRFLHGDPHGSIGKLRSRDDRFDGLLHIWFDGAKAIGARSGRLGLRSDG